MSKNKYDSYFFWNQLFIKHNGDIASMFSKQSITRESVFFHGVIVNCNNTNPKDMWLYFPDIKAMLGFIKYIYMPTVFFTFLGNEDEIVCPDTDSKNLIEYMKSYDECNDKRMFTEMMRHIEKIDDITNVEENNLFDEIILYAKSFEGLCNKRLDKFAYFNVFQSPSEVGEYIINSYKDDENVSVEDIENQLGVGAEEWLNICNNVYNNNFMNRKFTEILNNRIMDML